MTEDLKNKYEYLKSLVVTRAESFYKTMDCLENNTLYLTAPASYKYHLCKECGLLEHSVNVAMTMIKLKSALKAQEISDETCVIVALLHDVGKVGNEKMPMYIENVPTEKQRESGFLATPPYLVNNDLTFMEHQVRSLYLLYKVAEFGLDLTEEEWGAIQYHNEPWDTQKSVFRKNKLMTLLQMADYWACCYQEENM